LTPAAEGPRPAGLGTNTAWNVADLSVGALTAIINSVVVARALGPTVLGRYQFILWAASIVSVLTMYGLPVTANRFIARYLATGHPDLAGTVVWKTIRYQALFALAAVLAGSASP
jgi:O-antigen/teichoic acid export membrane protein